MEIRDKSNAREGIDCFDYNVSKLRSKFLKKGIMINEKVWPDLRETYTAVMGLQNSLAGQYYDGETSIKKIVELAKDTPNFNEYSMKLSNTLKRINSEYDIVNTLEWSTNYDIVSSVFKLMVTGFELDNSCYNINNTTLSALEHNLNYYEKIGPTSLYVPELLELAEEGYERYEEIRLSDEVCDIITDVMYHIQMKVADLKITRGSYEDTADEAFDKNNKGAESFPCYGNTRDEDTRDRIKENYFYTCNNYDPNDVHPATQLYRVQKASNLLIDEANIHVNETTGLIMYSESGMIAAINSLMLKRGTVSYYSTSEVKAIPELSHLITIEDLPESYKQRENLVNSGLAPSSILHMYKDTNEWTYVQKVTCPNIWGMALDKYPDRPLIGSKMLTKHRGIKALPAYISRLAQTLVYPFSKALRDKMGKFSSPDYGMTMRLSHPDYFLQYFTDLVCIANPQLPSFSDMKTTFNKADMINVFGDTKDEYGYMLKSDDKTGFDMFIPNWCLWMYACCYLSIAFESLSEEDINVFKTVIASLQFSVVITPNAINIYSQIIPSGHGLTSDFGSFVSMLAGEVVDTIMFNANSNIGKTNPDITSTESVGESDGDFNEQ